MNYIPPFEDFILEDYNNIQGVERMKRGYDLADKAHKYINRTPYNPIFQKNKDKKARAFRQYAAGFSYADNEYKKIDSDNGLVYENDDTNTRIYCLDNKYRNSDSDSQKIIVEIDDKKYILNNTGVWFDVNNKEKLLDILNNTDTADYEDGISGYINLKSQEDFESLKKIINNYFDFNKFSLKDVFSYIKVN